MKKEGRKVSSQQLETVPRAWHSVPATFLQGSVARPGSPSFLRRKSIRTLTRNPDFSFTLREGCSERPLGSRSMPTLQHKASSDLPSAHSAHPPTGPGSSQEAVGRASPAVTGLRTCILRKQESVRLLLRVGTKIPPPAMSLVHHIFILPIPSILPPLHVPEAG